ncbi:MAG: hypothetical protein K8U57_04490 [Planctomycetes bacterium]|nr:hypothetical protein [Planctomycetota bacterium]
MATATKAKRQGAIQASLAAAPVSAKARRQHQLLLLLGQLIRTIDDLRDEPIIRETCDADGELAGAANYLFSIIASISTDYAMEMAQRNFPWTVPVLAASN